MIHIKLAHATLVPCILMSLYLSLSPPGRQPIIGVVSRILFSSHLASTPIRPLTPRARHIATGAANSRDIALGTSRHARAHTVLHSHTHTEAHQQVPPASAPPPPVATTTHVSVHNLRHYSSPSPRLLPFSSHGAVFSPPARLFFRPCRVDTEPLPSPRPG